jgi:putative membrane protein
MGQMKRVLEPVLLLAVVLLTSGSAASDDVAMSSPSSTNWIGVAGSDVAAILMAAHQGEIEIAHLATAKAVSPAVRAFAGMMARDHGYALSNARAFFANSSVAPNSGNRTAAALHDLSNRTRRNLSLYSGAAFDRTYMQTQVDMHTWLLNQIDSTLMPSARGEMRMMIAGQREAVAADLEEAQTILGAM